MRTAPDASEPGPKRLRRPGLLGFIRDVAGNATTETVIMIPVFVVIWGGIFYTHQRYRKAINMAQFTRAHTWAHAFEGCEGDPPGTSTTIGERAESHDGFIDGAVSMLFGSGILPGFQLDEIEGRRRTSLERPAVLGEGTVNMGYNVVMLCNERRQDDGSFWDAAWGMFF
jgi:hypothetical protein